MFKIRRVYSFKGKTFCLSVFKSGAYWTVHEGLFPLEHAHRVQRQHDEQVQELIKEQLVNS